jgi:excisionase family DNA binding protein
LKLYTRKELSKLLRVHINTIDNMIKRGDIKALKIGRTVRISQEELDYLLKGEKNENNH